MRGDILIGIGFSIFAIIFLIWSLIRFFREEKGKSLNISKNYKKENNSKKFKMGCLR